MTGEHLQYRQVRQAVGDIVREAGGAAGRRVPACPDWTVLDLVRHLVEVSRSVLGRLTGHVSPELAPDLSPEALLRCWDESGARLEQILAARTGTGTQLVADAFTHELDLRYALARPLPAEHPAYTTALDFGIAGLDRSLREKQLPALALEAGDATWVAGAGEPVASVRAARLDLYRSLAGRRTAAQISRLSWSSDPERWLPAFTWGPFTPPSAQVEESAA